MNKRGFTMVETIIAMMIVSVIAIGLIPAITNQIINMTKARKVTGVSFQIQDRIEKDLYQLRTELPDKKINEMAVQNGDQVVNMTFSGSKSLELYRSKIEFEKPTPDRQVYIFLSQALAKAEKKNRLFMGKVELKVKKGVGAPVTKEIVDLTKGETLIGEFDDLSADKTWHANLYTWYVSDIGLSDPQWSVESSKSDFKEISPSEIPRDRFELSRLEKYANRYMMFSVTPVDIHGVRGTETVSNNRVYVLGPEWRGTTFAYADKNENIIYDEDASGPNTKDVKIPKPNLFVPFDSSEKVSDLINPENKLDPGKADIYVPSKLDAAGNKYTNLVYEEGYVLQWITDKALNIAADIEMTKGQNIEMTTRQGPINLWQFVKFKNNGQVDTDPAGKPKLVDRGPSFFTKGSIVLKSIGSGSVNLAPYSKLSGNNIYLEPRGKVFIDSSVLEAKEKINIDTAKSPEVSSSRDITISGRLKKSTIFFSDPSKSAELFFNTTGKVQINNTDIVGNSKLTDNIRVNSLETPYFVKTALKNINLLLNTGGVIDGGGWIDGTVVVPDGKTLIVDSSSGVISNEGDVHLSEKGIIVFQKSMDQDLKYPLKIKLDKDGDGLRLTMEKYIRRYFLSESGILTVTSEEGEMFGNDDSGMKYVAQVTAGSVKNLDLRYEIQDSNKLIFTATGVGNGSAEVTIQLMDKLVPQILSNEVKIDVSLTPETGTP